PVGTNSIALPGGYFLKIQGLVIKDSVKNVGRFQRFHPPLPAIYDLRQRVPQQRVVWSVRGLARGLNILSEFPVLVVVFVGRPIPVDSHPQPSRREAAQQPQLAVIADVARIAVLHGKSSFKPADAT